MWWIFESAEEVADTLDQPPGFRNHTEQMDRRRVSLGQPSTAGPAHRVCRCHRQPS
jgi:hypothetical protein